MGFLTSYLADTERVYNNAVARTLESTDGFTSTLVLYQPTNQSFWHGLLNEAYTLVLCIRRKVARVFGLMTLSRRIF